jgi:hypothetical protein
MHKVLVICQRKYDQDGNEVVNSSINDLVFRFFGIYCDIKYCSNIKRNSIYKGFVDYDGEFGDNEWTETNFIKQSYSLIILNTCPLLHFNYNILKNYLKEDGLIAITIYLPNSSVIDIEEHFKNNMNQKLLDYSPYYQRIQFSNIKDALIYKKNILF